MVTATKATLDGSVMFVQLRLQIASWTRQTIERAAAGLDGIVSVDLGQRRRSIVQRGVLRAFSHAGLDVKLNALRVLADGRTHTLTVSDGSSLANVRVDGILPGDCTGGAGGVRCEFEIRYTQLGE